MMGIIDPQEVYKLRQCLQEIYEASKEKPVYSETEKRALIRHSKLTRPFTKYEADEIYRIHDRIPAKPKVDEPEPAKDDKRDFFKA